MTAVISVLSGLDSSVDIAARSSLYFALAMVATAVMFLGVGAVTSQLAATRRQAAALAASVLGVSYALRLMADAGVGLHGLDWLSPLGWVEELQPLTTPQPVALVPIAAFTTALACVAVYLAGAHDVGESIIADRAHARPHLRLLFGPTGLALRLMRPTVIGWSVAIALSGLLFGLVAKSAGVDDLGFGRGGLLQARSTWSGRGRRARRVLSHARGPRCLRPPARSPPRVPRSPEALDHVLIGPVSRTAWLGGRFPVALAVLVLGGVVAGVSAWLGATSQDAGVSFSTLLGAGLNLVPPAVVILGIGTGTRSRPRATSPVVYAVLGWSLLLVIVGGIGATNHWILDTSVFHQMAASPAVPVDWTADGIMVAVAVIFAAAGTVAFRRRDLSGA